VRAHQQRHREHQHVAEQQAVDRLAHHLRILAHVEQQQQHQLAGKQHRRAGRRDHAKRQRHIEDGREIRLEEMRHAERAEEGAEADAMAQPQQHRQRGKIDDRIGGQQHHIGVLGHAPDRGQKCLPLMVHLTRRWWRNR
jgi:hypothetical protein